MNDECALVAAVNASPADDTVRLAFADWLEENAAGPAGMARAEVVRLQIAYALVKSRPVVYLRDPENVRSSAPDGGPILSMDGRTLPHGFGCLSRLPDRLVRDETYDLVVTAGGHEAYRLRGAYCTRCDKAGPRHPGDAYRLQFWVTGEKGPTAPRKDDILKQLKIIRDAHDLMPGCAVRFIDEYPLVSNCHNAWWERGFATRLVGTWGQFKRVADSLLWHPDDGHPCPATAHPVEEVRLTTAPNYGKDGSAVCYEKGVYTFLGKPIPVNERGTWPQVLNARWPGRKWVLP